MKKLIEFDENDIRLERITLNDELRDDLATMEHPFFVLKAGMTEQIVYQNKGILIKVKSTSDGIATVFDKDLWIYVISKLNKAYNNTGELKEVKKQVVFPVSDYLKVTGRSVSGKSHQLIEKTLSRLKGTVITTNYNFNGSEEINQFGLIESWSLHTDKSNKLNQSFVKVTLPDWLISSVIEKDKLLKINKNFFKIKKAIHRRIYELGSKHIGNKAFFKINIDLLLKKTGSTLRPSAFLYELTLLSKSDNLPELSISIEKSKKDNATIVVFTKKPEQEEPEQEQPKQEPQKKRKNSSKSKIDYTVPSENFDKIPKGFRGE